MYPSGSTFTDDTHPTVVRQSHRRAQRERILDGDAELDVRPQHVPRTVLRRLRRDESPRPGSGLAAGSMAERPDDPEGGAVQVSGRAGGSARTEVPDTDVFARGHGR